MARLKACSAPCDYRTYGKYIRVRGDKRILNKKCKAKGHCALDSVEIGEDGKCTSFRGWDE